MRRGFANAVCLNIKNPEAHALAEKVAHLSGDTLTGAVMIALREKLARLGSRLSEPWLSVDHGDLLYDERGLPK